MSGFKEEKEMLKDLFWLIVAIIIAALALFGIILKIVCVVIAIIAWLL